MWVWWWALSASFWLNIVGVFQIIESDDSSSSSDTAQKPANRQQLIPKNLEALLKSIAGNPNMTSLESMAAAQIAAFQRLPELNQLNPFYPSRLKFHTRVAKTLNYLDWLPTLLLWTFFCFHFRCIFPAIPTANITYDDTRSDDQPIHQSADKCRSSIAIADESIGRAAAGSQRQAWRVGWWFEKYIQVSWLIAHYDITKNSLRVDFIGFW